MPSEMPCVLQHPHRDPVEWKLEGSQSLSGPWETLHAQDTVSPDVPQDRRSATPWFPMTTSTTAVNTAVARTAAVVAASSPTGDANEKLLRGLNPDHKAHEEKADQTCATEVSEAKLKLEASKEKAVAQEDKIKEMEETAKSQSKEAKLKMELQKSKDENRELQKPKADQALCDGGQIAATPVIDWSSKVTTIVPVLDGGVEVVLEGLGDDETTKQIKGGNMKTDVSFAPYRSIALKANKAHLCAPKEPIATRGCTEVPDGTKACDTRTPLRECSKQASAAWAFSIKEDSLAIAKMPNQVHLIVLIAFTIITLCFRF